MNFLKKGPELKLSELKEIKVPGFVQDVYYDLKDRHLLPIAAILLIALVAVPIALSQSSSEGEEPAGGEAGASVGGTETRSGELVAKAAPGLRDYRRRLRHLREKDPFIQQYTGTGTESSTTESVTESTESGLSGEESTSTESSSPETSFTPTESSSGDESGEPGPGKLRYYSYAIDVKVSAGGSGEAKRSEPTVRRNLPELTMLPSRETPAIVYMGSTRDGKKALFVVSSDVDSVFGDAKCVLGSTTCQMLAMQPGLPETFVYGGSGKTYKIELTKIHLVETKDLNRAPLGEPKNSGQPKLHPHGQRLAVGEEAELAAR